MSFSEELLEDATTIWNAQKEHPFVVELANGTLDPTAFEHWVKQDYRYLLDYARTFAIAGARVNDENLMTDLLGIAHSTLDIEMELHREFAASYGITEHQLETTQKAPTCQAYTDFLVRTAYEGSIAEISAALFPCGQGYLDIGEHMADVATEDHKYTPFIEMYTSDEFREIVDLMRDFMDECGNQYPGQHKAMETAFTTSARLEFEFWEMAYSKEDWTR